MLLSMTGYGRVVESFQDKTIIIEIRSLNSKFTDIRLKVPQNFKEKETDIRRIVSDHVERGKIDLNIEVQSLQGDEAYGLNKALFKKYYKELKSVADELQMTTGDIMTAILRLPNVVAAATDAIEEKEWKAIQGALNKALEKFKAYRMTEGKAMEVDMNTRIQNIQTYLGQLDPHEEERVTRLRQRLHQNLEDYLSKDKIDENRFEQEILFYLEKIDINEEKVRLSQHCKYFVEELEKGITLKGRKLSFISQEMGREINTMGAKAYSSNIQRLVVSMKDELEKIKEQVANSL
ncbi:MAG: YicC/YloC family endoribonuclease [Bacteroidota bacterium]